MLIGESWAPFREISHGPHSRVERVRADQVHVLFEKNPTHGFLVSAEGHFSPIHIPGENHVCQPFLILKADGGREDLECIELARADALKFVEWACGFFRADPSKFPVFFSGKRGFHICVSGDLISMSPATHHRLTVSHFALFISEFLNLETIDLPSYSKAKYQLRLSDSINPETKNFCVQVSKDELAKHGGADKTSDADRILTLSAKPRGMIYEDKPPDPDSVKAFSAWWKAIESQYLALYSLEKLRPVRPISKDSDPPECQTFVSFSPNKFSKDSEHIELAIMAMASSQKDYGVSVLDAVKEITHNWLHLGTDDSYDKKHARAIVSSITKAVYAGKHHFSCGFMKSMEIVTGMSFCGKKPCHVNKEDMQPAEPPEVPLDMSANPMWVDKRIKVRAIVSGLSYDPFLAPKKISVSCEPGEGELCSGCQAKKKKGDVTRSVGPSDPILLELIMSPKSMVDSVIRDYVGIPMRCRRVKVTINENYALSNVTLSPVIRSTPELLDEKNTYVDRAGIYVDPGGKESILLEPSREYEATAHLHKLPKDMHAVLQIVGVKPAEDYIEGFKITPDLQEKLKVFQPSKGQTAYEKWKEIYADLEGNALRIYSRFEMFATMDLVFHGITKFWFDGEEIKKGWMEGLVIGDTGEGKTRMAMRLIQHYGLGFYCSAETSRRTGLLYLLQQNGDRWIVHWGSIPLNDRRLVVIDETHGLKPEDMECMTSVRSEGYIEVQGAAKSRTYARTRLIFLANPPDGRTVREHNYGVDTIQSLMKKPEDVRRIDIADIVAHDEVPVGILDKTERPKPTDHIHKSDLCNRLVLWAWSRKQNQVEFTKEAVDKVHRGIRFLADKYTSEIPLCNHSDLRDKIARGAVSVAARMFSTTDGEVVRVTEDHVVSFIRILDDIYSSKTFGYLDKSTGMKKARASTRHNVKLAEKTVRDAFPDKENLVTFCETMLNMGAFVKKDVGEMVSMDRKDFDTFFIQLMKFGMVQRRGQYWTKSEFFGDLMKQVIKEAEWEEFGGDAGGSNQTGDASDEFGSDGQV